MKIVGVIPARYQSSRFPGKPLVDLNGTPMIVRVANIVEKALGKTNTYIATDNKLIKDTVESYGFNSVFCMSTLCCNACLLQFFSEKSFDFSNVFGTFFHQKSMKKWFQEPIHKKNDLGHEFS